MSQDAPRIDLSVVSGARPAPFPGFHRALSSDAAGACSLWRALGSRNQARWLPHASAAARTACHLHTAGPHGWTLRFRTIADALTALPADDLILDGEAVVADSRGISDFGLLHADLAAGRRDRLLIRRARGRTT
jgi:hypothetical protein